MLADLVRTDRHNHRRSPGTHPTPKRSGCWPGGIRTSIWARTRHTNALRNAFREYYPAALEAFSDLADRDTLAVLGRAPTPLAGARLSITQLQALLRRGGRQRNLERRAREFQAALRSEQLTAADPVAEAFAATTTAAVAIIAELNRQISQLETTLADRFEQHPDADIYLSLPGLGDVLGARALGEFGDDPDRYATTKSRRNYAGTSPLTIASGRKRAVLARHVRTAASTTPSTNGPSARSRPAPAAEPSTTPDEPPATSTTKRSERSATDSSASSTAASDTTPPTTNTRLGAPSTRTKEQAA